MAAERALRDTVVTHPLVEGSSSRLKTHMQVYPPVASIHVSMDMAVGDAAVTVITSLLSPPASAGL